MEPKGLNNLLGVVPTEELFAPEQRRDQKRPLDEDIEKIAKKSCLEQTSHTSSSSSFQASIGQATGAAQVARTTLLPEAKNSSAFTFQFYRNNQPIDDQNHQLDLALLQTNCPALYQTFFCYQESRKGAIHLDLLPINCQDAQKWLDLLTGFSTLINPIHSENVLGYLPYLHFAGMQNVLRNTISELKITSENFQQLCQIARSLRLAILADRLLVYAQETMEERSEDSPILREAFSQLGRFRPNLMLNFPLFRSSFESNVNRQKLILSSFKDLESLSLYFNWLGIRDDEGFSIEDEENNQFALRYVATILDHLRTLHTPDQPLKLKELRFVGSPAWIAEYPETLSFMDGGLSLTRVRAYVAEILKEPRLPLTKLYVDMDSRDIEDPETSERAINELVEILTPVKAVIPSLGLRLNTLKLSETLLQKLQDLRLQELKEGYSYNLEYDGGDDDALVYLCHEDNEGSNISINESVLLLVNSLLRYTTRLATHIQSWSDLEEVQFLNIHFIDLKFLLEHLGDERLKKIYSLNIDQEEEEELDGEEAQEVAETATPVTWESFVENNAGLFRNREHPDVQALEAAIGALSVKKLSMNYPHCNINLAIEKWIKKGLVNLEELTIVGYKGSVDELQAILKQRKGLKYTIICDGRWVAEDAKTSVYTGGQKFLHKGEINTTRE